MTISRRALLGAVAGLLATPVLGAGARAETAAPLRRSRFVPLVGATVRLDGPTGSPARIAVPGPGTEGRFRVQFTLPAGVRPVEGIHTVRHPALGAVPLFLSPVGASGDRLEAVVNRAA